MKKVILIIRILLIASFADAQQSNNNFSLNFGTSLNADYGIGFNSGFDITTKNNIILKSQITAINNEAKLAPKKMSNTKPKDKFVALGLSAGYQFNNKPESKVNFNLLAGVSKIKAEKNTDFKAKPEQDYLDFTGNTAVDVLIILPINLLTNTRNEYTFKTEKIDKIAYTITPEVEFTVGKNSKIALNTNTYFTNEDRMYEMNLLYKLKF